MIDDIKKQEDELMALKATQVVAGSQLPIYKTTSATFSGSITTPDNLNFYRTITFKTTAGYHYLDFALSSFVQTNNVGYVYIGRYTLRQLPQDGSGNITIKLRIESTHWQSYPAPPSNTTNFTYSITAFGDATGTFS